MTTKPHATRRVPRLPGLRAAVLAAALLLTGACSSVAVRGDPGLALRAGDGWAWSESMREPLPEDEGGVPWRAFMDAVEAGLSERGLRSVAPDEAAWRVAIDLRVALRMRENNAFFNPNVGEKYERGSLTLVIEDAGSGATVWSGETERHLRDTARTGGGPTGAVWFPVDAERDWSAQEMVERVVRRVPVRADAGG